MGIMIPWMIVASVALSGIGQILLRAGAMSVNPITLMNASHLGTWTALLLNGKVVAGLLCWSLATLAWVVVLGHAPLSYAYCLGSINYIMVPLLSRVLLHEKLTFLRSAGMVVIFLGVLLTLYGRTLEGTAP